MRGRLIRRLLVRRLSQPLRSTRPFAHNLTYIPTSRARPQLAFLSIPSKRPHARYFTTERLVHEAKLVVRYTFGICGIFLCVSVLYWAINQESLERDYPTPHEWSFITRVHLRNAANGANSPASVVVDWPEVMEAALKVIKRLEDPNIDGKDLKELLEGSIYVDGVGKLGNDVTDKSENWRRGYYEALMLTARAAEQLDRWVLDKSRGIVFPPEVVRGPSNPHPKPVRFGSPSAPKEEDCEVAYEPAENYYLRILTTKGFTARQKMDAALAYASFLDFKKLFDAADSMYRWALSLAVEDAPPGQKLPYDERNFTLDEKAGPPSANVLSVLTALGTHKVSSGDVAAALPIFISVLKARRSLSDDPPPTERAVEQRLTIPELLLKYAKPPAYPPPPDDGNSPPWRSTRELCQEAGLSLYIGEILFANRDKEEGVSWTREAVDVAEEQLRAVHDKRGPMRKADDTKAALKTCSECLETGLFNWRTMAVQLAREEAESVQQKRRKLKEKVTEGKQQATSSSSSWFWFWSSAPKEEETKEATAASASASAGAGSQGRWAAEEKVAKDRIRRTRGLLEDVQAPKNNFLMAMLKA